MRLIRTCFNLVLGPYKTFGKSLEPKFSKLIDIVVFCPSHWNLNRSTTNSRSLLGSKSGSERLIRSPIRPWFSSSRSSTYEISKCNLEKALSAYFSCGLIFFSMKYYLRCPTKLAQFSNGSLNSWETVAVRLSKYSIYFFSFMSCNSLRCNLISAEASWNIMAFNCFSSNSIFWTLIWKKFSLEGWLWSVWLLFGTYDTFLLNLKT